MIYAYICFLMLKINLMSAFKSLILKLFSPIIFLFFIQTVYGQTNLNVDSLIQAIEKMPDDTLKVNALNDFVWKIKISDFDNAVKYGNQSLELAKKSDYVKGVAYATKNMGAAYYYRADYEKAYQYYQKSLEAFEQTGDKKGIAIALRNLGNVFYQISDWKQALDNYFKSLELREEIGDKKGVAAVNDAIGLVYASYKTDDFKTPAEYHNKALKINEELGNEYGISTSYLYLGRLYYGKYNYFRQKEMSDSSFAEKNITPDTAIMYLNECRKISKQMGNVRYLTTIDDILGQLYLSSEKYDSAYHYFINSLDIKKQIGNTFGIISSYIYLATYYKDRGQLQKSKKYLEDALALAKDINSRNQIKEIYGILADVLYNIGEYKSSTEILYRYIALKDSLQNEEKTKEMTQLAMQHEFDKKERLRELEEKKKAELQAEKDKRDKLVKLALSAGLVLMLFIAFIMVRSYKRKVKANRLLKEMNTEISEKNAILNQQKEEIQAQAENLQEAYDKIEKQHKNITDSIVYAQRIQEAVLPPKEYIDSLLKEYFILYKPRDIVSGDYYWVRKRGNKKIIIAADCTGHGVPGAFMSLLAISNLNEIVNHLFNVEGENIKAGSILDKLRESIKKDLRQTGKEGESKDGMDMSVCILDEKQMKIQIAGAQNPVLLIRNGELIKFKADRMPVGVHYGEERPFSNTEYDVQKGDKIYMLSDGYIDQFGGEKGRKFMMSNFKKLLLGIYTKPMREQKEIINKVLIEWQNHPSEKSVVFDQIDDILVLAFEV